MTARIKQETNYKMIFTCAARTQEDYTWLQERMKELKAHPDIMECFQSSSYNPYALQEDYGFDSDKIRNNFVIYYRNENNEAIDRFLFKVKLRFPKFSMIIEQTVQEYS